MFFLGGIYTKYFKWDSYAESSHCFVFYYKIRSTVEDMCCSHRNEQYKYYLCGMFFSSSTIYACIYCLFFTCISTVLLLFSKHSCFISDNLSGFLFCLGFITLPYFNLSRQKSKKTPLSIDSPCFFILPRGGLDGCVN